MRIDRTALVGIGATLTFTTEAGQRLGVICHAGGRRDLAFYDPFDPDKVRSDAVLDADEARDLADLLHTRSTVDHIAGTGHHDDLSAVIVVGLRVTAGPLMDGHRFRHALASATCDGTILAVIRGRRIIPKPDLLFEFLPGDTVIAAGTPRDISALHSALTNS